jgi:hypothetical protein
MSDLGEFTEAEPLLRECLMNREKTQPDDWTTFDTQPVLDESLSGPKKYAEAEPLLLMCYEGLKASEWTIPPQARLVSSKPSIASSNSTTPRTSPTRRRSGKPSGRSTRPPHQCRQRKNESHAEVAFPSHGPNRKRPGGLHRYSHHFRLGYGLQEADYSGDDAREWPSASENTDGFRSPSAIQTNTPIRIGMKNGSSTRTCAAVAPPR